MIHRCTEEEETEVSLDSMKEDAKVRIQIDKYFDAVIRNFIGGFKMS